MFPSSNRCLAGASLRHSELDASTPIWPSAHQVLLTICYRVGPRDPVSCFCGVHFAREVESLVTTGKEVQFWVYLSSLHQMPPLFSKSLTVLTLPREWSTAGTCLYPAPQHRLWLLSEPSKNGSHWIITSFLYFNVCYKYFILHTCMRLYLKYEMEIRFGFESKKCYKCSSKLHQYANPL